MATGTFKRSRRSVIGQPPLRAGDTVSTKRGLAKVVRSVRQDGGVCLYKVEFPSGRTYWFDLSEMQIK